MDLREEIFVGSNEPEKLKEVEQLRLSAWGNILPAAVAKERFKLDEWDLPAWHVCLSRSDTNTIVACSRLTLHEQLNTIADRNSFSLVEQSMTFPLAMMSRLAVLPAHQGRGYATRLDDLRLQLVYSVPVKEVWIEARSARVNALRNRQFEIVGKSADESVPGEWVMMKRAFQQPGNESQRSRLA